MEQEAAGKDLRMSWRACGRLPGDDEAQIEGKMVPAHQYWGCGIEVGNLL